VGPKVGAVVKQSTNPRDNAYVGFIKIDIEGHELAVLVNISYLWRVNNLGAKGQPYPGELKEASNAIEDAVLAFRDTLHRAASV
jgi:hypothetical protein